MDRFRGRHYEAGKFSLPQQERADPSFAGATIVQKSGGGDTAANEADQLHVQFWVIPVRNNHIGAAWFARLLEQHRSVRDRGRAGVGDAAGSYLGALLRCGVAAAGAIRNRIFSG